MQSQREATHEKNRNNEGWNCRCTEDGCPCQPFCCCTPCNCSTSGASH